MRWIAMALTLATAAAGAAPNILLIVADDMGFSDAGCYGGEIRTPNLDRLAAEGLRYTQCYNTGRCWPSRAALLTGYYAQQVRRDAMPQIPGAGARGARPAWAKLLPELLKPAGYRAYHSGKWHVDGPRLKAGFDRSYSLEDHDRYFNPKAHFEDDQKLPAVDVSEGYYATRRISDHAVACLKDHAARFSDRPFFQYLAFTSPHFPLQAPAEDIARCRGRYDAGWDAARSARIARLNELGIASGPAARPDAQAAPAWNLKPEELARRIGPQESARATPWDALAPEQKRFQAAKMEIHAAMVERMDAEIGRVLAQVEAMGAAENTIVLFVSDNGASAEQIIRGDGHDPALSPGSAGTFLGLGPGWSTCANAPLRLHKSWVCEGGISTPLIIRWPGQIKDRGSLRRTPCHLIDLTPTLVRLAGQPWPRVDPEAPIPPGKDLAVTFQADRALEREYLWWFHEGHRALRVADWKAVALKNGPWELYDLKADRAESRDLAQAEPARLRNMTAMWERAMEQFAAQAAPGAAEPQADPK